MTNTLFTKWNKYNKQPNNKVSAKPTILYNPNRYLSADIVNQCFKPGSHNLVDKQITGNGFTTSFLKTKPKKDFQANIIIAPNRQVILEKKRKYDEALNNDVKIGFIFGDENTTANSDIVDFDLYDVLMFVSDSFLMRMDMLKINKYKIDKILIDESHSVIIGATYRRKLSRFTEKVKRVFKNKAIVSVTATPLLFQVPNIIINNALIEKRTINITQNTKASLKRLKTLLANGEKCIVATQNARIVKSLATNNTLNANFRIGKRFQQSLVELFNLEHNLSSNLTIISSSGFEGWDVDNGENNVFVFEDRSQEHETFFSANIIQIIGRSRKGTKSIEWVRCTNSKGRTAYPIKDVMNVFFSTKISTEKKITDKNYYYMKYFFDLSKDERVSKGMLGIEFDVNKWHLYNEKQRTDNEGLRIYKSFFTDRGFTLKYLDEGASRLSNTSIKNSAKEKNILLNKEYIINNSTFEDYRLIIAEKQSTKEYLKHWETFLRRKYWDKENKFEHYTQREHITCSILYDKQTLLKLETEILDFYKAKKLKEAKTTFDINEAEVKYNSLRTNISSITNRLLMMFASDKIALPKKIRVWRDYNLLVEVSYNVLKLIAKKFNVPIAEIDVRTCNPRILYALCNLELPKNFYGENKKNKRKINVLLNSFAIREKKNIKKDLIKYGFHTKVINFLLKEFCDKPKPKGALFNLCAYHEQKIIHDLQRQLIAENKDNATFIRRHDSVISFGDFKEYTLNKKEFEYLGVKGWFNNDVEVQKIA